LNGQGGLGVGLNFIASQRRGWLTLHLNNEGELSRNELAFVYTANLDGENTLQARLGLTWSVAVWESVAKR
jgi:hypothetical protein